MGEAYLIHAAGLDTPTRLCYPGSATRSSPSRWPRRPWGSRSWRRQRGGGAQEAFRAIDHHYLVGLALGFELMEVVLPYFTTNLTVRRTLVAEAAAERTRAGGAWNPPRLSNCTTSTSRFWRATGLKRSGWPTPPSASIRSTDCVLTSASQFLPDGRGRRRKRGTTSPPCCRLDCPPCPEITPFRQTTAVQRLAADLALDAGDLPAAASWLEAYDSWLVWSGAIHGRADGQRLWGRYHLVAGDLDRAKERATLAVAMAAEPHQPLTLLEAHRLFGRDCDRGRAVGGGAVAPSCSR